MTIYNILLNCGLGWFAIFTFICAVKMIKAKEPRGVTISVILMGISVLAGITLDIIQAFFLSDAPAKYLRIIQRLDANVLGYYLGLATFFILCVRVKKKDKIPNQRVDFTVKTRVDEVKVMRTESHP